MEKEELQKWFESLDNLLAERVQLTGKEHKYLAIGLLAAHTACFPPEKEEPTKEE